MRAAQPCYLVEWYHSNFFGPMLAEAAATLDAAAESLSTDGAAVRVASVIAVPHDEVAFGVLWPTLLTSSPEHATRPGFPRSASAPRPMSSFRTDGQLQESRSRCLVRRPPRFVTTS